MPSAPAPKRDASESLGFGRVLSHLGVMVAISAVIGLLVGGLAIPWAGALGAGSKQAVKGLKHLPQQMTTAPLAEKSRLLASNGKVIATFYATGENRSNVTFDEISPIMRKSIVAIEDYRFYEHGALDLKGTLRAFLTNQASGGSVVQGGSSITQQLAKLTELNQARTAAERKAATADTYSRKILELRHAIAFEQNYSKDWILTRYLNLAYFGGGAYGIQSAARHYFSVDAKDLNLKQSALLAGLVKNPNGYDPTSHPAAAKDRRNTVLARMAQLKIISEERATRLERSKLGLKVTASRNGCVSTVAPFFCDYAYRYLLADPSLGKTVDDRRNLIQTGGLTIKSTLDLRFQTAARDAVKRYVRPTDNAIGALAMVQPGTGNVKAISQSRPMGSDTKKGQTYLNYVVPQALGDSGGFQAGSTFKVFVLAAALDEGLNPRAKIQSPKTMDIPQNTFPTCDGNYPNSGPWPVSNYDGRNYNADMYLGAQESVNTYFAQLEKQTGLCEPYKVAKSMGVELSDPAKERVPSFTLGIASVSPLEMAGAYATLAARGTFCAPKPVTEIRNAEGKIFKKYGKECKQVMSRYAADTINDILRGVMRPGGFGSHIAPSIPSAGKTGTIQFNKAVWFDGYTPALASVAMVAGANSLGTPISLNYQSIGGRVFSRAFGSTVAGPIWGDSMRIIQQWLPADDFVSPTTDTAPTPSGNLTIIPSTVGLTTAAATAALQAAGFTVVTGPSIDSIRPKGLVAGQNPDGGSAAPKGTSVTIFPSNGANAPKPKPSRSPSQNPSNGPGNGNGNGGGNGGGGRN